MDHSRLCKVASFDPIHDPPERSIYVRTDYIAPLDMTIPLSLAAPIYAETFVEGAIHTGFPPVNREPALTPIVLLNNHLPKGR